MSTTPVGGTNRGVFLDERPQRTVGVRARPAPLPPPPQPHRPAERRQIHQHHAPIALGPQRPATCPTGWAGLRERITTFGGASSLKSLISTRSTSARPTNNSHMRAGISHHQGSSCLGCHYQHLILEDPSSLLVDSDSPRQIPSSPLLPEEPVYGEWCVSFKAGCS